MRIIKDQLARLSAAEIRLGRVRDGTRLFRSTRRSSRLSISGFRRTTGSASCGLRSCGFPSTISRACNATPCRLTSGRCRPVAQRHGRSISTHGWRSACTASTRTSPPSSRGRRSRTSSAGTMAGWTSSRQVFRQTLDMVLSQYRGARLELDDRGMTLRNSPPPGEGPDGPDLQSLRARFSVEKPCDRATYPRPLWWAAPTITLVELTRKTHDHFGGTNRYIITDRP